MTERLSTRQMIDSQIAANHIAETVETARRVAELHEKVKVFEAVVWFPKLQAAVNATSFRGMKGTCRGVKIMTWCCAGRCLIQLERADHTITLITADDEAPWVREMAHVAPSMGPMGIQGIDADFVEALKMLYVSTRWGNEIVLVPDDKVTIA